MNKDRIMKLRAMPYEQYLQTPEWAAKRDQALERDGYRCRACDSREKLNVHHRTYARRGNEDLNDLTTLCQPCHEHFHQRIRQVEIMLQTYTPPIDHEARKKEGMQQWEDRLVGLLINDAYLIPHVIVMLRENDLTGTETRALFQLIVAAGPDKQSDLVIPPSLMQTFERCRDFAQERSSEDQGVQIRTVVRIATHLRKQSLLEENTMLKNLLQEAANAGDKTAVRDIQQKSIAIQRQLMTLNTASRLQDGGQA